MISPREEVSYDTQHKLLHFKTENEGSVVPCAVSKAALALLEDDALAGPEAMATTYRRNRRRIHELALKKYHEHRLEEDGVVVVRAFDVQTIVSPYEDETQHQQNDQHMGCEQKHALG